MMEFDRFDSEVMCILFFFFQAEDGIRDLTVTGVQTCALPIWVLRRPAAPTFEVLVEGCCWRSSPTSGAGAVPAAPESTLPLKNPYSSKLEVRLLLNAPAGDRRSVKKVTIHRRSNQIRTGISR